MLNSFFDKYIFTNTLKYTHNNFYLVDIPFAMVPIDVLLELCVLEDTQQRKKIYSSIKSSTKSKLLPRMSGFTHEREKEILLLKTFLSASGWGSIDIIDMHFDSKRAIVVVENSPFANQLRGKSKFPVDVFMRGILAGAFSVFFKEDVDCVEAECFASGGERCKFIVKPIAEFDLTSNLVKDQLFLGGL
ncbi:MAG: 4-vinyl reductase [archaeon]